MPYDFDAFMEDNSESHELFVNEIGSIEVVPVQKARDLFPNVVLSESPHLSYFPYILCHSLPTTNRRGRCFTGKVLHNSFASAVDQLLNIEHLISDNGLSSEDKICGHIKAVRVGMGKEVASEIAVCPTEPMPVVALGCLFNRAKGIKSIIENHNKGKETWKVSMECAHDWRDAYLKFGDDFIPLKEADSGMLQCIKRDKVMPYKDRELAVCLGGLDGKVDFWGAGITKTPADKDAAILHFIAAGSREVASATKSFYMPFQMFSDEPDFEVASKIEELASVSIIGETDPDPSGDVHTILSDMTIMPSPLGHDHSIKVMHVKTGSSPVITGVTDAHRVYRHTESGSQENVHAHTFSIKLKGKKAADPAPEGGLMGESASHEDIMTLKDMLKKLNESLAALSKTTNDADRTRVMSEIANIEKEIVTLENQNTVQERIDADIKSKLDEGSLLRKEDVDKLVNDKVAEATKKLQDEAAAKQLETEKRNARLQKLQEAGISKDFELEGLKDASGNQLTIGTYLPSLPIDEAGENQFTINFNAWKQARDLQAEKEKKEAEANQQQLEGKKAEAASKPKPSIVLTPGGANTGKEVAKDTNEGEQETVTRRQGGFNKKAVIGKY